MLQDHMADEAGPAKVVQGEYHAKESHAGWQMPSECHSQTAGHWRLHFAAKYRFAGHTGQVGQALGFKNPKPSTLEMVRQGQRAVVMARQCHAA